MNVSEPNSNPPNDNKEKRLWSLWLKLPDGYEVLAPVFAVDKIEVDALIAKRVPGAIVLNYGNPADDNSEME